eukprot:81942_1
MILMIKRIQTLHGLGILHCDVKPDNYVFGNSYDSLYLIDYGLAQLGKDIPMKCNAKFKGTPLYASPNVHNGISQSERDDMISIAYIGLELINDILPWHHVQAYMDKYMVDMDKMQQLTIKYMRNIDKYMDDIKKLKEKYMAAMAKYMAGMDEIKQLKEKYTSTLFQHYPIEFKYFMDHCQQLAYGEQPDYEFCINLFRQTSNNKILKLIDNIPIKQTNDLFRLN